MKIKYFLYVFLFLSVVSVLFSCKNEIEEAFKNLNQRVVDSVTLYSTLNDRLFQEVIEFDLQSSDQEYISQIYNSIQEHNTLIDSIIALLNQHAVNPSDRGVSTKYLIEKGNADNIKKELNELVLQLESMHTLDLPEHAKQLFWSMNDYEIDSGKTWAEYKFKHMPIMVTETILNQFKLNNTKASALILVDIKERMK